MSFDLMDAMLSQWAAKLAARNEENWKETKKVMKALEDDEADRKARELAYREGYSDGFAALREDYSKWMEDLDLRLRRLEDSAFRIEDRTATILNWCRTLYGNSKGFG